MTSEETRAVRSSEDVVVVRQLVRAMAVKLGFSLVDQTKIVTAASELARNTVDYGGGGTLRAQCLAEGDQERIFQEFGQVDSPVQRRVRGTGLGLPLSRKLATLLGGTLTVESEPGVGSTFQATIPVIYVEPEPAIPSSEWVADPLRVPVLVVEDSPEELMLYEKFLKGSGFHVVRAMTTRQARHVLGQLRPAAIVLDILLRGEDSWTLLAELKRDPATRDIPVLIVSTVDDPSKGLSLGADAYAVKPVERRWLLDRLQVLTGRQPVRRVLVIDDDEISRYLVRGWLDDVSCLIVEARGGEEGLRRARQEAPDAIVLDLVMPDVSGFEVLERLRAEAPTRDTPVVVVTSKVLEETERRRLQTLGASAVVSKAADRDTAATQLRTVLAGAGLVVS